MILRYFTFCLILFTSFVGFCQTDGEIKWEQGKKYQYHLVKQKETLYSISKQYGVKVNDILLYNTHALDVLKEGMILKIPLFIVDDKAKEETIDIHDDELIYVVKKGETLYSICKSFEVSEAELKKRNPSLEEGLKEGMKIVVPVRIESLVNEVADYSSEQAFENVDDAIVTKDSTIVNIAVLLPFYLDQNDTLNKYEYLDNNPLSLPKYADVSLSYFMGVKIALDSLKSIGLKANLKVFDTAGDSIVMKSILAENNFNAYDLVIGPAYSFNVKLLTQQINQNTTALVSPFYNKEEVLSWNKQMLKIMPNEDAEIKEVSSYIQENHVNDNVVFLYESTQEKDYQHVKSMETSFATYRLTYGDSVKTLPASVNFRAGGVDGLLLHLDTNVENVLVVPSLNEAFVTNLFLKLTPGLEDFEFRIIGMDNWKTFSSFEPEYFELYKVHIPSVGGVDYEKENVNQFIQKYYSELKNEPTDFSFQAFDITYFLVREIGMRRGYKHIYIAGVPYEGFYYDFNFKYTSPSKGLENNQAFMVRFNQYKMQKLVHE